MFMTAFFQNQNSSYEFRSNFGFVMFGYMIFQTLQQNESSGSVSEVFLRMAMVATVCFHANNCIFS